MLLSGWFGIGMIIFCAIISAHASAYLAECWVMVEEKWPEYQAGCRNPFATIGEKGCGIWMKYLCSFLMDIQLFGVCVVFLIFMSESLKEIYDSFIPEQYHFGICLWIIIFGIILIPLSLLGSPAEFKIVAYAAMLCTG